MINGSPTNLDTLQIDYLYDEEGTPYGGVYRSPTDTGAPIFFAMLTTDRGDVLELLDANGDPFAGYRYDVWGNPTGTWTANTSLISDVITPGLPAAIANRQVLRYASYVYDSESGLYYLSARSYDPATAQFISPDLAKADGEESAYQYCGGQPVTGLDPTGEYAVNIHFPPYRPSLPDYTEYFKNVLRLNAGMAWKEKWVHIASSLLVGPPLAVIEHFVWFYNKVKEHGQWDFKWAASSNSRDKKYIPFDGTAISPNDFGNIHFGYVGRSYGFPLWFLKKAGDAINALVGQKSPTSQQRADSMTTWGYNLNGTWGKHYAWPLDVNEYVESGGKW